jgi:hypothetical protein
MTPDCHSNATDARSPLTARWISAALRFLKAKKDAGLHGGKAICNAEFGFPTADSLKAVQQPECVSKLRATGRRMLGVSTGGETMGPSFRSTDTAGCRIPLRMP